MKFLNKKSVRLKKANKQQQKNPNTITAIDDLVRKNMIEWDQSSEVMFPSHAVVKSIYFC